MISRLSLKRSVEAEAGESLCIDNKTELLRYVEGLYDEHYLSLYRFLLLQGCQPNDADDYLQESFLRLLRFLKRGDKVDKPKSWLLRVLHNLQIDEARRLKRVDASGLTGMEDQLDNAGVGHDAEAELLKQERLAQFHEAIGSLTPQQSRYLLLRTEGLKLREIADLHGVTVQTVAEVCARALDRLGRIKRD
jgi:RNA polymerase sigma-70 factor (ECF subfamily)